MANSCLKSNFDKKQSLKKAQFFLARQTKLSTGVDFTSCGMDHRAIQFLIYLNLVIGNAAVVLSVYLVHWCLF